ncbi:MAG TPA: MBL fold metallo-hydrolase [Longimicrobiales bacterium]|nr:MBL fold metallo-hydrolase [Longimicrobiales bacterium]
MEIATGVHCIDVGYQGRPDAIAAGAIETGDGVIIVDPGPASCLPGLRTGLAAIGLSVRDITAVLLTHIHLDHAGGTGTLVSENPAIRVFVHERGARHVIDPSRLLASALRIYGDALPALFGDVVPVPDTCVTPMVGGETIEPGHRRVRVEYAPGHASHHVAWLDEQTGTAFVGDTAGERFAPSSFVLPVTPPPDIDLERWQHTMSMLRELNAERLFITHFGVFADVERHLDEHDTRLGEWAAAVRHSLDETGTDEERADRFEANVTASLISHVGEQEAAPYAHGGMHDSWYGLARYWRARRGE